MPLYAGTHLRGNVPMAGFVIGTGVAVLLTSRNGDGPGMSFATAAGYFGLAEAAGVVTCLLGSWFPARAAAALDPAEMLREE